MIYLKGIYSYSQLFLSLVLSSIHVQNLITRACLCLISIACHIPSIKLTDKQKFSKIFGNFFLSQTFICSFYSLENTALPFVVYNHYLHDFTGNVVSMRISLSYLFSLTYSHPKTPVVTPTYSVKQSTASESLLNICILIFPSYWHTVNKCSASGIQVQLPSRYGIITDRHQ